MMILKTKVQLNVGIYFVGHALSKLCRINTNAQFAEKAVNHAKWPNWKTFDYKKISLLKRYYLLVNPVFDVKFNYHNLLSKNEIFFITCR